MLVVASLGMMLHSWVAGHWSRAQSLVPRSSEDSARILGMHHVLCGTLTIPSPRTPEQLYLQQRLTAAVQSRMGLTSSLASSHPLPFWMDTQSFLPVCY